MSKSHIDRIKDLILTLPEGDIKFGNKFLNDRNFESLKELIDSSIIKVTNSRSKEIPNPKYDNVNLEELNRLKGEVDFYIQLLGINNLEEEEDTWELDEDSNKFI